MRRPSYVSSRLLADCRRCLHWSELADDGSSRSQSIDRRADDAARVTGSLANGIQARDVRALA